MSREMITTIAVAALPLLLAALSALGAWAVAAWARYVKDRRLALALELAALGAASIVAELAQTLVQDLKDPTKPGTWDQVAKASVRSTAILRLRMLYPQAVAVLTAVLRDPARVDAQLGALVERAVVDLNNRTTPPQVLSPEASRGTEPPRVPTAPQAGFVRPWLLAALALVPLLALAACPPRPTPIEPGPSQPVSGWTSTARAVLSTLRWALPAARAVTDSLLSDPPRTQVARALDAAADAAGRLDVALSAYESRGGDRCVAHAAAGGVVVALEQLADVLADNGIALGVVLGRVVDGAASIADALVPACASDAGWTSAGDTANARLRLVEDVARRRGIALRRDLDGITEPSR